MVTFSVVMSVYNGAATLEEIVTEHGDDAADRLSRGAALDPQRLRDRAAAHESVYASARRAASEARGRAQFRAYATLAKLIGWTRAGKLACLSDRLRW
ncbi:MAG TPA: hypothetical protein VF824_07245 [Thermoanaerobaculia bacterium]|jgi:hypothetical protein